MKDLEEIQTLVQMIAEMSLQAIPKKKNLQGWFTAVTSGLNSLPQTSQ